MKAPALNPKAQFNLAKKEAKRNQKGNQAKRRKS